MGVKNGALLWDRPTLAGRLAGPPPVLLGKDLAVGLDPDDGHEVWRRSLKDPWLAPRRHGELLLFGEGSKLTALHAWDGKLAWEVAVPGPASGEAAPDGTLGPWWSPDGSLLALRNGQVWMVLEAASGNLARPTSLAWLDRHAEEPDLTRLDIGDSGEQIYAESKNGYVTRTLGQPGTWKPIPGKPVAQIGDVLLLAAGLPDMARDARGRVIVDLKTGLPRPNPIEGYVALRLPQMHPLEGQPRSEVVGSHQTVGEWALYTTQDAPGGPGGPSEPDPVLHGRKGDQLWTYQGPFRPDWTVVGDRVMLVENDRLKALDPTKGKVVWESPPLKFGDGPPTVLSDSDRLLVQTAAERLYALDPQGKLLWTADLRQGFLPDRLNHLICLGVLSGAIAWFILAARRRGLFIRPIAGLKAVENAVGRATEMGKPILFVPGLEDVDEIQTLAALSILRHVARKAAEYDSTILVPTRRAVVMSTAQEVVKEAYTAAGRPDGYHAENIRYLTDDQFGFVVGVDGIMLRERPAANFYLGMFYAESLILAETGYATGAIQIAGTAAPSQLPFFVAACDYTLIGEELYAASAYLSQDPLQIGSLRGQDVGKALVMLAILIGTLMMTFGHDALKVWFEA